MQSARDLKGCVLLDRARRFLNDFRCRFSLHCERQPTTLRCHPCLMFTGLTGPNGPPISQCEQKYAPKRDSPACQVWLGVWWPWSLAKLTGDIQRHVWRRRKALGMAPTPRLELGRGGSSSERVLGQEKTSVTHET